jgi:surfeit locus 1 family protein
MKRVSIIVSTLVVIAACAAMIKLGLWQLNRRSEKLTLIQVYTTNLNKPEMAFNAMGPIKDDMMFRRAAAHCISVAGWVSEAGRAVDGSTGYRWIAQCGSGAEGPGMLVDMGVSNDPAQSPKWTGGPVTGRVTTEPDHTSFFAKMQGKATPLRPLLVSTNAAPGLRPSAPPNPQQVSNPHLAYAVQWFIFALIAALIYGIALRARLRKA